MTLGIEDGLTHDLPQITLAQQRQSDREVHVGVGEDAAALLHPGEQLGGRGAQVARIGDLGSQVVEGIANIADRGGDVTAHLLEEGFDLSFLVSHRSSTVDLETDLRE